MHQAQQRLRANLDAGICPTIVMADLDRFKAINDSFGHDAGDRVIRAFSDACRSTMRTADLVGREADGALHEAKAAGRNRALVGRTPAGTEPSR